MYTWTTLRFSVNLLSYAVPSFRIPNLLNKKDQLLQHRDCLETESFETETTTTVSVGLWCQRPEVADAVNVTCAQQSVNDVGAYVCELTTRQ